MEVAAGGRDWKAAIGDDVVETSEELAVVSRASAFFFRFARHRRFECLPRFDRAAGKCDLSAVRGHVLRAARKNQRPRSIIRADERDEHRRAAMFGRVDLDGGAAGEHRTKTFE